MLYCFKKNIPGHCQSLLQLCCFSLTWYYITFLHNYINSYKRREFKFYFGAKMLEHALPVHFTHIFVHSNMLAIWRLNANSLHKVL